MGKTILSEILILTVYGGGIFILSKIDEEFEKCKAEKIIFLVAVMAGAAFSYKFNAKTLFFLDVALGCSLVNCYTDLASMSLYNAINMIMFAIGMVGVFMIGNPGVFFSQSVIIALFTAVGYLIKGINKGDIYMLIGIAPSLYLLCLSAAWGYGMVSYLFLLVSLMIGVLINAKKFFVSKVNRAPFAVPVLITYLICLYAA